MEYTVNLGKESLRKIADAISGAVEVEPLEVTENGEYTAPDGKAYSPVSVNVESGGSSDASIAKVTIKNSTSNEITMTAPAIQTIDGTEMISVYGVSVRAGNTETYDMLIYKDITEYPFGGEDLVGTVSGNVELVDKSGEGWLLIKGDGEIEITAYTPL